jgi:phenylpyruvate tautomerase PptA (4-oxalocrotonate tautomerase family)
MPLLFLEAPTGLDAAGKAALMAALTEAVDRTYRFPDTRVFLREYPAENVCQDGRVGAGPVRPVAFLEAPELTGVDARRALVVAVQDAVEKHYAGLADTEQTLVLINEYPLDQVGWLRRLQSDNPQIVEAVRALNA